MLQARYEYAIDAGDPTCLDCQGRGFVVAGPVDDRKMIACRCNSEYYRRRQARLVNLSGMSEQELALTLDDVVRRGQDTAQMLRAAREFVAQPYGFLTLWGGVGNGKTLTLQAIVNELREGRQMEGAYVTFYALLNYIRAGFDDKDGDGDEQQRFRFLRSVPVLAIDEVDKVRMTEYADEFRTAFFDERYRAAWTGKAHTVLAMNCDPAELPDYIYDRLRDGRFVIVHNDDPSMRPAMPKRQGIEALGAGTPPALESGKR